MFTIDPRVKNDSILVDRHQDVQIRLMHDGRFFWALLVPEVEGAEEIHDLDAEMRHLVADMTAFFSKSLLVATGCDKVNTAAIGNIVRMLHIHIIARSPGDAAWPGPVWGNGQASPLTKAEEDWRSAVLKDTLKRFRESRGHDA